MQLRIWIFTILLAAGLAACAPEVVPTPQQTPETELAEHSRDSSAYFTNLHSCTN
jgi:hypothetical protein